MRRTPVLRTRRRSRSGMAPLEFILVYPTFLALLCCSMWIAVSMLRKGQMTILARFEGDTLRQTSAESSSEPFEFEGAQDGRTSTRREMSFRFSNFMPQGNVSASYTVLVGAWDHEQLPMDVLPDYPLAFRLSARGPVDSVNGKLQGALALLQDVGGMLQSLQGLMQSGSLPAFFQLIASQSGGVDQSGFSGDSSELLSNSGGKDFDQMISSANESLLKSNETVNKIADAYRKIVGVSQQVMGESRAKAREARERAEELEQAVKDAAAAVADPDALLKKVNEALDAKDKTPDERRDDVKAAAADLQKAFDDIEAAVDRDLKAGTRKVVDKIARQAISQLPPATLLAVPGLAAAVRQNGLAGLRETLDSTLEDLDEAIADEDEGKIQKARRSLASIMTATRDTLRKVETAVTGIADKVRAFEDKSSRTENSQIPGI